MSHGRIYRIYRSWHRVSGPGSGKGENSDQSKIVSTEGFTPFDCAQFCAHQQSRSIATNHDGTQLKLLVHSYLSQFVTVHRNFRKLLSCDVINPYKQEVAGSSPALPTISNLKDTLIQGDVSLLQAWHG